MVRFSVSCSLLCTGMGIKMAEMFGCRGLPDIFLPKFLPAVYRFIHVNNWQNTLELTNNLRYDVFVLILAQTANSFVSPFRYLIGYC